jgi:hypothetical protein
MMTPGERILSVPDARCKRVVERGYGTPAGKAESPENDPNHLGGNEFTYPH